ncbi:hypothetical protein L6164_033454 [Bauhinia variegata]|uniref:Uncharacterized protein n=1 Tax=Bauhinia variegata TaxID=167791 RepID=A0ACB9KSF8_BAUVA|nr:hypothetical protein L6164_033454 [Bauhinia variegata]
MTEFVLDEPAEFHLENAFRALRYPNNSPGQGIFLSSASLVRLTAYSDSYRAWYIESEHSITGFFIFQADSLICCKSKKQQSASHSPAEAASRAMSTTSCEITWLTALPKDFGCPLSSLLLLYTVIACLICRHHIL